MHPRLTLSRRHVLASLAGATNLFLARRGVSATAPFAITITEDAATGAIFDPPPPSLFALRTQLRVNVTNALRVPVALGLTGIDGLRDLQPLLGRPSLEPGATLAVDVPLNQSGTFLFEGRLVDDGSLLRLPKAVLAVAEASPPEVDQDRILLIEDARRLADITPSTAGSDAAAALTTYSVNGQPTFDLKVRANERLRLRVVNGCHRNAIALQVDDHDLRVISIDSRPAEPFMARDRRLVLAPGTRIDVLVDATGATSPIELFDGSKPRRIGQLTYADGAPVRPQPLPLDQALNDPPARLDLASAFRVQIDPTVGGLVPADFVKERGAPVFRVKRGRTVLCTLTNPSTTPTTLHLHGHHFRWLDRLDDGWKPFTPDTLLLDVGQTERIAFVAQYPGDWLIEAVPMDWSQPRRLRWFAVE